MGDWLWIALLAALNPTLLTATTIMLLMPNPRRLMLGYLLGATLTSVTIGTLIVLNLDDSSTVKTTRNTLSPAATIALGVVAIALSWVLATGRHTRVPRRRRKREGPPRWQQALGRGSPRVTFAVGAALTLPGVSYLVGLHRIHLQHYPDLGSFAAVVLFNVVMLVLLEGPLISFTVAPDWTHRTIERGRAWFNEHAHNVAIRGFAVMGGLLVAKGVAELLS